MSLCMSIYDNAENITSVLAYWYLAKCFWLLLPFYGTIKETAVISYGKTKVSTDDLLVDSLHHSVSTADSELHRLLLDCNATEEEILTRTVKELKAILYGLGI